MKAAVSIPLVIILAATSAMGQTAPTPAPAPTTRMAADIPPMVVNISLKDVPPDVVFEELEKQCGVEFRPLPDKLFDMKDIQKPITVDYKDTPFWVAVQDLSRKSGLSVMRIGMAPGPLTITKPAGGPDQRPTSVSGGFVAAVNNISCSRSVVFTGMTGQTDIATLSLSVFVDPKARLAAHSSVVQIDEAVDDKGQSLKPDPLPGLRTLTPAMHAAPGAVMFTIGASLKAPPQTGARLARIKGYLDLQTALRTETWEIADVKTAKGAVKKIGGWTITIKEVNEIQDGKAIQLKATEHYEGPSIDRGPSPLQSAKVTDAKGTTLTMNNFSGLNDDITVSYQPTNILAGPKPVGPIKLVAEVMVETQIVRLPIEFKDLPLP